MKAKQIQRELRVIDAITVISDHAPEYCVTAWGETSGWVIENIKTTAANNGSDTITYNAAARILARAETSKMHGRANKGMAKIREEWRKCYTPLPGERMLKFSTRRSDATELDYRKSVFDSMGLKVRVTRQEHRYRYDTVRMYVSDEFTKQDYLQAINRLGLRDGWTMVELTETCDAKDYAEIDGWCLANIGALDVDWIWGSKVSAYHFKDDAHAAFFRLRWG